MCVSLSLSPKWRWVLFFRLYNEKRRSMMRKVEVEEFWELSQNLPQCTSMKKINFCSCFEVSWDNFHCGNFSRDFFCSTSSFSFRSLDTKCMRWMNCTTWCPKLFSLSTLHFLVFGNELKYCERDVNQQTCHVTLMKDKLKTKQNKKNQKIQHKIKMWSSSSWDGSWKKKNLSWKL